MPEDEQVVLKASPSMSRGAPFSFALCWLLVIAACVGLLVLTRGAPMASILRCLMALAAGFGLLMLLIGWLHCRATELTVTTHRTTLRQGLLSKDTTEVRHQDVRVLKVDQSILQRLTNAGSIEIGSSGTAGIEITAKWLKDPQHIADIIRKYQQ